MQNTRQSASRLHPNPTTTFAEAAARAASENGRNREALNLLQQAAYLLTLLDAELIVADDFPVTQPAWYGHE